MINFKSYIEEALDLSTAKAAVRASAGLYKTLYPSIFEDKYRLYYDIDLSSKDYSTDLNGIGLNGAEALVEEILDEQDNDYTPFDVCLYILKFLNKNNTHYKELINNLKKSLNVIKEKVKSGQLSHDILEKKLDQFNKINDAEFNNFYIKNYKSGIVYFIVSDEQYDNIDDFDKDEIFYSKEYKIGGLLESLGNKGLLEKFKLDPIRLESSGKYKIVVSRHPYDIVGMSTGRGWTSCMNLKDGCNRHYVNQELRHGTIIAYLVKDNDLNITNPISRILLKPYINKKGIVVLYPQETDYSRAGYSSYSNAFKTRLLEIVDDFNNKILDKHGGGKFDFFGAYDDNDPEEITIVKSKNDIIDSIKSNPMDWDLIPFILYDLNDNLITRGSGNNAAKLRNLKNEFSKEDIDTLFHTLNRYNRLSSIIGQINSYVSSDNYDEKYKEKLFLNSHEILKKYTSLPKNIGLDSEYINSLSPIIVNHYYPNYPININHSNWEESKNINKRIKDKFGYSESELADRILNDKKVKGGYINAIVELLDIKEKELHPNISKFLFKRLNSNISNRAKKVYKFLHNKNKEREPKYEVKIEGFPLNTNANINKISKKDKIESESKTFNIGDNVIYNTKPVEILNKISTNGIDQYAIEYNDETILVYPFELEQPKNGNNDNDVSKKDTIKTYTLKSGYPIVYKDEDENGFNYEYFYEILSPIDDDPENIDVDENEYYIRTESGVELYTNEISGFRRFDIDDVLIYDDLKCIVSDYDFKSDTGKYAYHLNYYENEDGGPDNAVLDDIEIISINYETRNELKIIYRDNSLLKEYDNLNDSYYPLKLNKFDRLLRLIN